MHRLIIACSTVFRGILYAQATADIVTNRALCSLPPPTNAPSIVYQPLKIKSPNPENPQFQTAASCLLIELRHVMKRHDRPKQTKCLCLCLARRPVNGKSICPASVNHESYRVRSRGFSLTGGGRQGAEGNSDIPRQSA